jgi:hypothetical protein
MCALLKEKAMATLFFSSRSVSTWNSNSAPLLARHMDHEQVWPVWLPPTGLGH